MAKIEIKKTDANNAQSGIEKRNVTITKFALFTLVPLLLCLLLGFSLSQSETQNKINFQEELSKLENEKKILEDDITQLKNTFFKADSLLKIFKQNDLVELEGSLRAQDNKIGLNNWDNQRKIKISNFETLLKLAIKPEMFNNNNQIQTVILHGKNWLMDYSSSKSTELYATKVNKEEALDVEMDSDLEANNQELRKQIFEKDLEIASLKNDKKQSGGNLQIATSGMEDIKGAVLKTKEKINSSIEEIREQIIPELKPQRWKNKNGEQIQLFKEKLEAKLTSITTSLSEL